MGMFHFEENEKYRLGIWKMEEDETDLNFLLGEEIQVPFKNPGKRVEFLSVRALAKHMDIDPLSISYLPSGKPFLSGSTTNISISHTKGYAAIMLSDLQRIGIDIEHRSDRVQKVRHKFMRPDEETSLSRQPENQTVALLLHWSAKESLFKAIPDEGVDFMEELQITDFPALADKGQFGAIAHRSGTKFRVDYRIAEDFVLTACFPA